MFELSQRTQDYGISTILQNVHRDHFKHEELLLYEHSICSTIVGQ